MPELLSLAKLSTLIRKAEVDWAESRATNKSNLVAVAPTFLGLCEQSTVKAPAFVSGGDTTRKPEFDIAWIDACSSNPRYITDAWVRGVPCSFDGWTVGSNKQKIMVTSHVSDTFFIPFEIYDDLFTKEEYFTTAYNKCVKSIIEKLDHISIAKLVQFSGVNSLQDTDTLGVDGGSGATSWKVTKVPHINSNSETLLPYLTTVKRINKMVNPIIFTGGAIETSEFNEGGLEKMKFGDVTVYSDYEHFRGQGLQKDLFYVSSGAIGVLNCWNHKQTPVEYNDGEQHVRWSVPLPAEYRINGGQSIMADMTKAFVKKEIAENKYGNLSVDNRCEFVEVYNMEVKFEITLNPLSCNDLTTGVLRFRTDNTMPPRISPQRSQLVYNLNS